VAGYVVQMVGPALHWPAWVIDLAPFHHLATVPAQAFALSSALALLAVAAALTLIGVIAFERRDLVGA
jgi:ABC-2 type transport system permease protein